MKLKKFEQPLFDATDYNGFGRKVRTTFNPTGGPVPKFNSSNNNLGIESIDTEVFPKKIKIDKYQIDNWGFTFGSMHGMNFPPYNGKIGISGKRFGFFDKEEKGLNTTKLDVFYKLKMDIFTMEFLDDVINGGDIPIFNNQRPGGTEPPIFTLLKQYAKEKRKGCIANFPSALNFPYFKSVSFAQLKAGLQGSNIIPRLDEVDENLAVIIPNSRIDSLASTKVHIALKKARTDVEIILFASNVISELKIYNEYINSFAKETGYPVVDLQSLYEKITKDRYTTEDGIRVNNDNFFSSDGLHPSPFGNAIIANEFIKAINSYYKTEIPLIKTAEYLDVK
jgi:hypothetical protein